MKVSHKLNGTTNETRNIVTIAPSANKSFDINFCDENVLYNLLNKYNF